MHDEIINLYTSKYQNERHFLNKVITIAPLAITYELKQLRITQELTDLSYMFEYI